MHVESRTVRMSIQKFYRPPYKIAIFDFFKIDKIESQFLNLFDQFIFIHSRNQFTVNAFSSTST